MNGLQRYEELAKAMRVVEDVKTGLYRDAGNMATPASDKLIRVSMYLSRQAGNVMEGRTEDGKEEGDVSALRVLAKALGVEELERVLDGDVWLVVDMVMSANGYSPDEAEDIEERMAPAGWASVEGGAL